MFPQKIIDKRVYLVEKYTPFRLVKEVILDKVWVKLM